MVSVFGDLLQRDGSSSSPSGQSSTPSHIQSR